MVPLNDDMPESLDPRMEYVDRLLARESARLAQAIPSGLAERVAVASAGRLPGRRRSAAAASRPQAWPLYSFVFSRKVALAACMALLFVGGIWSLRRESVVPAEDERSRLIVINAAPEGFSAFLTPISDEELADDRAATAVLELGDAEYWAVEAELRALQLALELR
jgi:hypothetical protein